MTRIFSCCLPFLLALAPLSVIGCPTPAGDGDGDGDGGLGEPDAGSLGSADGGLVGDGDGDPDGGVPGADGGTASTDGGTTGDECDVSGFTAADQKYLTTSLGDFALLYDAESGPLNKVQLELFTGTRMPMQVALTGENFADCTVCLSLLSGCDGKDGACTVHHLAQSGEVNLTAYDDNHIAGTLSGIYAVEVTIDGATFMSTVVDGGQGWCLDAVTFDIPVGA